MTDNVKIAQVMLALENIKDSEVRECVSYDDFCEVLVADNDDAQRELELFSKAGFTATTPFVVISACSYAVLNVPPLPEGWTLIVNYDDFMMLLFKDGQPMAGYYLSTCGRSFFCDGYVVSEDKTYYAGNNTDGKWTVCDRNASGICKDYLLKQRGESDTLEN